MLCLQVVVWPPTGKQTLADSASQTQGNCTTVAQFFIIFPFKFFKSLTAFGTCREKNLKNPEECQENLKHYKHSNPLRYLCPQELKQSSQDLTESDTYYWFTEIRSMYILFIYMPI